MRSLYFLNDFERALDKIFGSSYCSSGEYWAYPLCKTNRKEIYKDNELNLEYAYPGHKKEDIEIFCEGDKLTLKINSGGEKEGYRAITMEETLLLKDYNIPFLKASYTDGVLKVILQKKEERKQKKLKIEF